MSYRVRKTEHAGAKNGGGFWGKRAEAKHQSSRVRRHQAAETIRAEVAGASKASTPHVAQPAVQADGRASAQVLVRLGQAAA